MSMPINEASALSRHPRLATVLPAVAQAARALYGRQLELADDKQPPARVRWQEVNAGAADVQIEAKWAGHVVDVQFVDASWWGALAVEWGDEVPEPIRRAAFVHAAPAWWQELQAVFGVVDVQRVVARPVPLSPDKALGFMLSMRHPLGKGTMHTPLLISARDPRGWRALVGQVLAGHHFTSSVTCDPLVNAMLALPPLSLTAAEVADLGAGDVLVLDAKPGPQRGLLVQIRIGGQGMNVVRGVLVGRRLVVVPGGPNPAFNSRKQDMNAALPVAPEEITPQPALEHAVPTVQSTANELDGMELELTLEVGRLSLPVSALRTLTPGQVFETHHPVDGECVVLWCGGSKLALGQLVGVGEHLGVRLTQLLPTAKPAAAVR
jgi:flagellar motor switch/type III secretory pathway protein FliN